ncbi:MAG: serine/threonine-protein kinase [Deltaproteobacteria bacterium]|jgi:serine/threonine protein kinase|nr:serine/threonine-protein kinase [Deltaproteobacteria bacterium]
MSKKYKLSLDAGSPENPTIFGKYLLMGLIARGGMAEVYRAKRIKDGKIVALKCMRNKLVKEQKYIDMFLSEGKTANRLNYKHIVKTYEGGRYNNNYFFTMEYIQGKDLNHILRKLKIQEQRLPTPAALFIAVKSLRALDYAHSLTDKNGNQLNIINRDISPSNIRISYEGKVKIIDFGIAKTSDRYTTEIGTLKGKFHYMSPEQIRGLPLDTRTDIYSMGIILYEMLTMERLFNAESETELMNMVRTADINPPSSINQRIPPKLDQIVLKSLKKSKDERYQKAGELADALEEVLVPFKFKQEELSNKIKNIFYEDYQREMEIMRLTKDMDFNLTGIDSSDAESFDQISADNFNNQQNLELEFDMEFEDEDLEPVHTEDLLEKPQTVDNSNNNNQNLNKYIYLMLAMTLIAIIAIIIVLILK